MSAVRRLPFEFKGSGTQYFGIWIVNLLLIILTLGIYLPWAKVRKLKFFYGHTELEGQRFDYTGDAWAIFKGRAIALGVLMVLNILEAINPAFLLFTFVVLMVAMPWLVRQTMRFKAHNARYRNIRFKFNGNFWNAFWIYIPLAIISIIIFPLLPYFVYCHKRYLHENLSFGGHKFKFKARIRDFYYVFIEALLLTLFLGAVAYTAIMLLAPNALDQLSRIDMGGQADADMIAGILPVIFIFLGFLFLMQFTTFVYLSTKITNLCWGYTSIGRNPARSNMNVWMMGWIFFSNNLLIAVTFGLFTPWAQVRAAKYRIESMAIMAVDDVDAFMGEAQNQVAALGEEAADVLDLDISL